jgi:hypothetical protein
MSISLRKRGDFIREKMGMAILKDLGSGKIDAVEAGDLDDLMRDITTSGVTFNMELAANPYYLSAVMAWGKHKRSKK